MSLKRDAGDLLPNLVVGARPYVADKPLVFIHIPKTAGTSLSEALMTAVEPRNLLGGFDRCLFGGFSGFATIDENIRRAIVFDAAELPPRIDLAVAHMSFSTLSAAYPDASS